MKVTNELVETTYNSLQNTAMELKVPFDLRVADVRALLKAKKCALSHVVFDTGTSPAISMKQPEKGYVRSNCETVAECLGLHVRAFLPTLEVLESNHEAMSAVMTETDTATVTLTEHLDKLIAEREQKEQELLAINGAIKETTDKQDEMYKAQNKARAVLGLVSTALDTVSNQKKPWYKRLFGG